MDPINEDVGFQVLKPKLTPEELAVRLLAALQEMSLVERDEFASLLRRRFCVYCGELIDGRCYCLYDD